MSGPHSCLECLSTEFDKGGREREGESVRASQTWQAMGHDAVLMPHYSIKSERERCHSCTFSLLWPEKVVISVS